MELQTLINDFEQKTNSKIVYLTKSGSHLYGTASESSDIDYKGIFIPSKQDVLLKKDLPFYSYTSGEKDSKNTKDDIDFHIDSLHTWFNNLAKGETGAIDLLFSMWHKESTVLQEPEFIELVKKNKTGFYGKNLHAFIGYCIGQARKSGIKGTRYAELASFIKAYQNMDFRNQPTSKLIDHRKSLVNIVKKLKHINIIMAPGPRGNKDISDVLYIKVLDKMYSLEATSVSRLNEKLIEMEASYGNRAKQVTNEVCPKSLSHSLRVILEVKELLETNHIEFPLKERNQILEVKSGNFDEAGILKYIEALIAEVDILLETTTIQDSADTETVEWIYLKLLDLYGIE